MKGVKYFLIECWNTFYSDIKLVNPLRSGCAAALKEIYFLAPEEWGLHGRRFFLLWLPVGFSGLRRQLFAEPDTKHKYRLPVRLFRNTGK